MASHDSDQLSYSTPQWWKEAVVYQIYPSSFQSHTGNTTGWGSIKGIASRLDYLKELGIDVVWSSPFFKSPQVDMGYDIADYKQIDSRYGTLDDIDMLIAELRKRDMKLMVDLVVNHTSDQHPWFLESRSSKDNPKRDWYIWKKPQRDGAEPQPPNNWASILGEARSAWAYDKATGEYYFSMFTPEQPDLNWENPDVRAAVWDVMHFWMQRGAAGFRLDVINLISKAATYPDAETLLDPKYHKYQPALKYVVNGPKLHDYLKEMNREVLSQYGKGSLLFFLRLDSITVGEMPGVNDEDEILRSVGANAGELRMIFIFDLVDVDKPAVRMGFKPWDLKAMRAVITRWQRVMIERNGWNAVFIENHDNPRSISRFADDSDEYRHISAKLLALMQVTLGGTLFVYQGEEIGMRNIPKEWDIAKEYKDIETQNYWKKVNAVWADSPELLQHGRAIVEGKARDHARTPMQWDASANAGFCDPDVTPWMRVMDDYEAINAEVQMKPDDDDESVWRFWQAGIRRRKEHANVFVYGDFEELTPDHPNTFAYTRTSLDGKGEKWLVLMNFFGRQTEWIVPADLTIQSWVCGNYSKGEVSKPLEGMVPLKPWEGLLAKCA
ncbi:glycoside hydrolase family 13 protein [Xylaria castorea]|nr:glycoside hydrolase family 13 protein [Xylaria castorea]